MNEEKVRKKNLELKEFFFLEKKEFEKLEKSGMLLTNKKASFVGKLKTKLNQGHSVDKAKEYFYEYELDQYFTPRNQIYSLLDSKEIRVEQRKLETKRIDIYLEEEGMNVEIVFNYEDNRMQLIFERIPSFELRKKMKEKNFRWSRKNLAWQRILTENAIKSISELFDVGESNINVFKAKKGGFNT